MNSLVIIIKIQYLLESLLLMKKELKMDAMLSSLVIIGKATEAVPEFVNLIALMNSKGKNKAA